MNSTFNFNRWLLLVKQHWAENRKRYLLSMVAVAGLLVMWFFFILMVSEKWPLNQEIQMITYFFLLFIGGSFFASQYFRDLSSKSRGINFLLTPASSFEKFLCSLLYAVILFFVTYTVIFYIVDSFMVLMANTFHPFYNQPGPGGIVNKAEVENAFGPIGQMNGTRYFFAAYFAVQSAFLLGSVYFEKYSLIKTIICVFVFFLIIYLVEEFLLEKLLPNGGYYSGLASYRVYKGGDQKDVIVELPAWIRTLLNRLLLVILPLWFWLITYHRLKEKEL